MTFNTTGHREIESLRELIERDLKDAGLKGLSADRKFVTNAALQLCKMAIACAEYRPAVGVGHRRKTFESVKSAITITDAETLADYFEICRRKRNVIDYDAADTISETEADELLEKAVELQVSVEDWIAANHSTYRK